jgi:hypothetical protein
VVWEILQLTDIIFCTQTLLLRWLTPTMVLSG